MKRITTASALRVLANAINEMAASAEAADEPIIVNLDTVLSSIEEGTFVPPKPMAKIVHEASHYAAYDTSGRYLYGAQKVEWLTRWLDDNCFAYDLTKIEE